MTAVSFLSPVLLYGLVFAAIPILIHLLFRRRYRRVEWAPMAYLKLSLKKVWRRIQLEQLLLLMVRVAAVMLLFFLVARPVMHSEGLGAWFAGGRVSHLLLLDDSLSMGYRDQGKTAFARAKAIAQELAEGIGRQDRWTLALASQPRQPLLRDAESTQAGALSALLEPLTPADSHTAWPSTLDAFAELVEGSVYPFREVTLLTDLRRAGWDSTLESLGQRLAEAGVRLRILDVGTDRRENLALVSLEPSDRVALVGTPTRYEATIRNDSGLDLDALDATWIVDGKPTALRLPSLPHGTTTTLPLQATFQQAGLHQVALELPQDELAGDNRRHLVTNVKDKLRMLLIDGEPASEPFAGETDFLGLALALGVDQADAWQVETLTDAEWSHAPLVPPDLLVLANIATLTDSQAAQLERWVEAGMGLIVYVGDLVDPDVYNRVLYREGKGLLPARLEAAVDGDLAGLLVEDVAPTPLQTLRELNPAVLKRIRVKRTMQVGLPTPPAPDVRVLARWNNPEGSPACLDKRWGHGHVLLWTVTADKAWTDWPTEPSYVLAVRESARAIVRTETVPRHFTAGEAIVYPLPAGQGANQASMEAPGIEGITPVAVESTSDSAAPSVGAGPSSTSAPSRSASTTSPPTVQLVHRSAHRAGVYRLQWKDARGADRFDSLAVNPDRRESALERLPADEVRERFGVLQPEVIKAGHLAESPSSLRGREIWRTLALGLLALLAGEACLAAWVGRPR